MPIRHIARFLLFAAVILLVNACKKEPAPIVPSTSNSGSINLMNDELNGTSLIVIGSAKSQFMVAFESTLRDGTTPEFSVKQRALPVILEDNDGNQWDIQGYAVEGPRKGEQLKSVNSYMGFWFSWGTMFPGIELYNQTPFTENFTPEPIEADWTIPTKNVFTVLGADGIPSIDNPKFEVYDERDFIEAGTYFIEDEDLVIGVTFDGITRIYPHSILNWHEIVNDQINDFHFSLSFCPITGTSVMWNRTINGVETTFGVSGLLYNGNVMPYDRATNSIWSQMKQECVNGNLIGTNFENFQVLESTWATWKTLVENPEVLTTDTGFGKDYTTNPYERYITDHSHLSYPVELEDTRLQNKERVLGVIVNGKAKAYRFDDFEN